MQIAVAHSFGFYMTLAATMIACLYLFVSVGRRLEKVRLGLERRIAEAGREMRTIGMQAASLEARFCELAERTTATEDRVAALAAVRRPPPGSVGVDANQRTQVLRLARRGERPEQIAAELRVPRNEVDLLLKVQRAVVKVF